MKMSQSHSPPRRHRVQTWNFAGSDRAAHHDLCIPILGYYIENGEPIGQSISRGPVKLPNWPLTQPTSVWPDFTYKPLSSQARGWMACGLVSLPYWPTLLSRLDWFPLINLFALTCLRLGGLLANRSSRSTYLTVSTWPTSSYKPLRFHKLKIGGLVV